MVTFESLPMDILIQIISQLDSTSQLSLGIVSKFISSVCIKQLWHTPLCRSIVSLKSILTIINNTESNFYPYATWIMALNISFKTLEKLPESLVRILKNSAPIPLRSLRLDKIDGSIKDCQSLFQVFIQPHSLESLELCNCPSDVIISIANHLALTPDNKIEKLYIKDSYLSDSLIKQMMTCLPQLHCFTSEGSGYISDTSILAIIAYCPLIETIIITLPNYLVQSNTITFISLEALTHCTHLTTFICKGQVRISNEESKQWLLKHCPSLKYCDLSF